MVAVQKETRKKMTRLVSVVTVLATPVIVLATVAKKKIEVLPAIKVRSTFFLNLQYYFV